MDVRSCRYSFVVGRASEMLGYPVERLLQDADFDRTVVHPDDYDRVIAEGRRAAEEGCDHSLEYRAVTADGRVIWLRDWIRVLRDAGGRPRLLRGVTVDVTERKAAEAILVEREEIFRQIMGAIRDNVYMEDVRARRYLFVSPAYQEIWGRPPDELYRDSRAWLDVVHPDDRQEVAEAMQRLEHDGYTRDWSQEYRLEPGVPGGPSGRVDPLDLGPRGAGSGRNGSGASDGGERPGHHGTEGTGGGAAGEAQERFEIVSRATMDAVWDLDVQTGAMRWNSGTLTLFGYPAHQVGPDLAWWTERVHPEDRDRVLKSARAVVGGSGHGWSAEYRFGRADGSYAYVLDRGYVIRDDDGRPVRMIGSMQDITDRRRTEEALRQVSARVLRSRDEERRRIARELHDGTAQVLAALGMNLEVLRKSARSLPAAARSKLAGSRRLLEQCVQEIRTLSYLLHPPILDEAGLTAAIRSYARGFADRSGIRVVVRLPRVAGRLPDAIELILFRIVQESLSNVHRHSGSPVARISMTRENGRIRLEVRDRGRGIAGFRSGSVSGAGVAIGVGIAGMNERVRQLGGDLVVDSSAGGTTVRVTLPVRPSA